MIIARSLAVEAESWRRRRILDSGQFPLSLPPRLGHAQQEGRVERLEAQRLQLFDAARRGVPVFPGLRVPEQGVRYVRDWLATRTAGRRPIVITLRQYGYAPGRNSNVAAWIEFARRLDKRRYVAVFVLDIATAMQPPAPAGATAPAGRRSRSPRCRP